VVGEESPGMWAGFTAGVLSCRSRIYILIESVGLKTSLSNNGMSVSFNNFSPETKVEQ
jgi:hypothetical protein